VAQDAGSWPHTALAHCLCLGMVDGAVVCGAPISRQFFSSLKSHIPREHHAVGLLKYTEVTKQARGQNRRRASLVRHFCQDVSVEGDPFTKVFRSWWILAKGWSAAGVTRSVTASRSRRTVSWLMSTGLALMGKDPPEWPLDCGDCCDGKRFRVVTADGIWVGYLKRLVTNYYKAYSEGCASDKELLQVASLIGSEWVRRFLRLCLNNAEETITITADQRKASCVALSVLCPVAVPPSCVSSTLVCTASVSVRVWAMLSELWDLPTCLVSFAKGLLAATTKVIMAAVAAQRPVADTVAELQLQASLRQWLATPRAANRNGPVANPHAGGAPVPAAAVPPPAVGAGGGGGAQAPPAVLPQIPFGPVVVPVVPTKSIDGWLPPTRALPDNMAQGLLSLIVAIVAGSGAGGGGGGSGATEGGGGGRDICCACSHPRVLGFVILDQREGPPALLNAIITRFPVFPEYIVYDFGCGAVRSAMSKLPLVLAAFTITSDQFFIFNHVCSVAFDPRSFATLKEANTVAHEQRNRDIKLLARMLRASGQGDYTSVLAYHMLVHNVRAHARSAAMAALPDVYDFGRFYFSREACLCGCGHVEADPFGEGLAVSSSKDEEDVPVLGS